MGTSAAGGASPSACGGGGGSSPPCSCDITGPGLGKGEEGVGRGGDEQTLAGDGETKGEEQRERPGGTVGQMV